MCGFSWASSSEKGLKAAPNDVPSGYSRNKSQKNGGGGGLERLPRQKGLLSRVLGNELELKKRRRGVSSAARAGEKLSPSKREQCQRFSGQQEGVHHGKPLMPD